MITNFLDGPMGRGQGVAFGVWFHTVWNLINSSDVAIFYCIPIGIKSCLVMNLTIIAKRSFIALFAAWSASSFSFMFAWPDIQHIRMWFQRTLAFRRRFCTWTSITLVAYVFFVFFYCSERIWEDRHFRVNNYIHGLENRKGSRRENRTRNTWKSVVRQFQRTYRVI